MAAKIIHSLSNAINNFEQCIVRILSQGFPPRSFGALAYDCDGPVDISQKINKTTKPFSLRDIIDNGFLWAAPKTRRPIEKRLSRKFGYPEGTWKMLVPKKNLVMCPNCGHDREVALLCGHCYTKVREETSQMQKLIKETLGLKPIEKEVVVIYENEKEDKDAEFWKSQKIVEMPKKRPVWFHSNLTQSTTQQPSESKEVKPTELA